MAEKPTYEELERRPKEVATEAVEPNRAERGQREPEDSFLAKKSVALIAGILILFGLYLSSLYNYLLFHTLAEIFSIVVACGIFIVAWNSRRILDNNYLLFLGIAFLFIGALDLVHTLGYTGMGIFQGYGTNLPAQLWIATRYMESLSLLIAPLFLVRRLKTDFVLMTYAVVTVLVLGSVFYWHIFPTCFIEGEGLTPFKKISEYIISIILISAITVLFQKRKEFDARVFRLLVASIALTIVSELAFTFYIHAYGFSNLVGHYLKITSFYLIYKAIIETALVRPYDLLFRNLKQSEEAVRKEKEFSEGLIDTAQVIILVLDTEGRIVHFNPYMEDLCGYKLDEVQGRDWFSTFLPEQDYNRIRELFRTAVGDIKTQGNINPIVAKDGREIITEWYDKTLKDAAGNTTGLIAIGQDITERLQTEEALQESEEKYRSMMEAMIEPIYICSPDFRVEYMNPAMTRRTGRDATGEFCFKALHDMEEKCPWCMHDKAQQGEYLELEIVSPKDNRSYYISQSPVPHGDGSVSNLTIFRDITEIRETEAQLYRAQKMEAMGLLAGGVAHDLNNILSGIVSYPELILMDLPEDSPLRRPIKIMQESGMRAADVVEDLLTIARGVATGKETLNLNTLITEYLESLEYQKLDKTHSFVNFETELDPDLLNMSGSPTHIKKTLMNLVINASEAIEGTGTVTISSMNRYLDEPLKGYTGIRTGEYAVLTVSDNGSGITPEDLEKIFEPFYTKKVMGRSGTGLGLAVVWNTVQDHKGYINVESSEKGTVFELYFPVTRKEVADEKEKTHLENYLGHGEKILVVDDEERQREIACGILTKLGYTAEAVSSGEEAIEYMKENTVDLIVLDMVMPKGINGRETYEQIIKSRPKQKAIIASGYAKTKEVDTAQELGAGKYIKKPYTLEKIGVAVKKELEK